jgi:uncharacterized membrane protein YozB (DUF420 family)
MNSVDIFSCGIDRVSESEVVDAVHQLNYLVNNLIANILAVGLSSTPRSDKRVHSKLTVDLELLTFLINHRDRFSDDEATLFVVEFIFRSLIFTIIYTHLFDGRNFFGIGSDHLRANLDRMMDELLAGGMSFPSFS